MFCRLPSWLRDRDLVFVSRWGIWSWCFPRWFSCHFPVLSHLQHSLICTRKQPQERKFQIQWPKRKCLPLRERKQQRPDTSLEGLSGRERRAADGVQRTWEQEVNARKNTGAGHHFVLYGVIKALFWKVQSPWQTFHSSSPSPLKAASVIIVIFMNGKQGGTGG